MLLAKDGKALVSDFELVKSRDFVRIAGQCDQKLGQILASPSGNRPRRITAHGATRVLGPMAHGVGKGSAIERITARRRSLPRAMT